MVHSELTERQKEILEMIAEEIRNSGRPPSIPEIMARFSIASPNGVAKHLAALEQKGFIRRERGARGIMLTGEQAVAKDENVAYLPLLGSIAAGSPILAEENTDDFVPLPKSLIAAEGRSFLLEVKGDSMIEDGIFSGDYVIVESGAQVMNGELAAVRIEDGATVKRLYREKGTVRLQPANSAYEPIVLDGSLDSEVIGRVTGLIRSYGIKKAF